MCYLRTDTGVYIYMYRDRITGQVWWYCSGKKRSVGTLGKKQTDRDDVCRACTRHVQIEKGLEHNCLKRCESLVDCFGDR